MSAEPPFDRLPNADEPMSKSDVEYWEAAIDAKAKTLACLCSLHAAGKGDEVTKKTLHALCAQIVKL